MSEHFEYDSQTAWDRADAMQRGSERPECAWVCTDRDVWHKNPFFVCPVGQPYPSHPEDDDGEECIGPVAPAAPVVSLLDNDDIPF